MIFFPLLSTRIAPTFKRVAVLHSEKAGKPSKGWAVSHQEALFSDRVGLHDIWTLIIQPLQHLASSAILVG